MSYTAPTAEEVQARRADLAPFDSTNERIWLSWYATFLTWRGMPQSYLDLGSGTGAMVNLAQRIGIESIGIDVINGPEHWFIHHNLEEPLYLGADGHQRVFEMVTCIEVAEHLPEAAANTLCDTIERHMHRHSLLAFSAASPGQGGEHHQNLQPSWYWRSKLHERGISYREDYTQQLAHLWSWVAGPLQWVAANVQVFDK